MKRKRRVSGEVPSISPSILIPQSARDAVFDNLQVSHKTGVAQDYLNKFLPHLFLESLVDKPTKRESLIVIARQTISSFKTYLEYLQAELITLGYSGNKLTTKIDELMSQKNAAAVEQVSQRIRVNFNNSKVDFGQYLSDYKEALTLICGVPPPKFKNTAEFASGLNAIFNDE